MSYRDRADALAQTMARQLRARGGSLDAVSRYAGRKLPRRLHRDAATLARAAEIEGHPKLARQIDPREVDRAERRLNVWLETRNPGTERLSGILDRLAAVAFVICLVSLVFFVWVLLTGRA